MNTIPPAAHPPLGVRDYVSVAMFAASWMFEIGEWAEDRTPSILPNWAKTLTGHVPTLPIRWSTQLAPYAYITHLSLEIDV